MKDWPTEKGSPCARNGKVGGCDPEKSQRDGGERRVYEIERQLGEVGRSKGPDTFFLFKS